MATLRTSKWPWDRPSIWVWPRNFVAPGTQTAQPWTVVDYRTWLAMRRFLRANADLFRE